VGREREVDALPAAATADEPPFLVALVHGPGGHRQDHVVGVARQAGFTRRGRVCGTPFNDVYAVRP
jgi:hypothetical protein